MFLLPFLAFTPFYITISSNTNIKSQLSNGSELYLRIKNPGAVLEFSSNDGLLISLLKGENIVQKIDYKQSISSIRFGNNVMYVIIQADKDVEFTISAHFETSEQIQKNPELQIVYGKGSTSTPPSNNGGHNHNNHSNHNGQHREYESSFHSGISLINHLLGLIPMFLVLGLLIAVVVLIVRAILKRNKQQKEQQISESIPPVVDDFDQYIPKTKRNNAQNTQQRHVQFVPQPQQFPPQQQLAYVIPPNMVYQTPQYYQTPYPANYVNH